MDPLFLERLASEVGDLLVLERSTRSSTSTTVTSAPMSWQKLANSIPMASEPTTSSDFGIAAGLQRRHEGFVVPPRRWVVQRTFSWFGQNRRPTQDFENLANTPGHLPHPCLYPARPQAVCQRGARAPQYTITKVGKLDCEGTFAGASGHDEVAPKAANSIEPTYPHGSTPCRHSLPEKSSLLHAGCIVVIIPRRHSRDRQIRGRAERC